jgi:hypothetical protein
MGGCKFLRNVGELPNYTALHSLYAYFFKSGNLILHKTVNELIYSGYETLKNS